MENESLERVLDIQPSKRKRSSILRPAEKRASRDLRTVSFNDKCIYKELHEDGTCDITNLFLRQDMDLTLMEVVDPANSYHNQTINSSMDMSMEQGSLVSNDNNTTMVNNNNNNSTLTEDKMIEEKEQLPPTPPPALAHPIESPERHTPPSVRKSLNMSQRERTSNSCQMDLTLISQFQNSMPKVNTIELPSINYDTSTIYDKKMSLDISSISSLNSTLKGNSSVDTKQFDVSVESSHRENTTSHSPTPQRDSTTMLNCSLTMISDVSSLNNVTVTEQSMNETMFGAFHDSNRSSLSQTNAFDTLMQNIEALNDRIQKVDQESDECRRKLDDELDELFKFYRHIINKENKYEFAIRIFGIRYSLWLLIKLNPDTYPNEKIELKFAVNQKDRHLYPFPEYAEAVRRCTKEGRDGYLTRFVINAQRFRRFLRVIGYKKPNK